MTGDNGLLTKASDAKKLNEEATALEKIQVEVAGSYGLDGKIDIENQLNQNLKKINGLTYKGSAIDLNDINKKITKLPATVILNGFAYKISENGSVDKVFEWIANNNGSYTAGEVTIKVGDYVNYDPTAGATENQMTYISTAAKSGWDSNQSFDARIYKNAGYKWRVLDVKNGKVRLISEDYVGPGIYSDQSKTQYYLKGQNGYINGIEELKAICNIFGHGDGAESATSITVEDVDAITGFNPNSPKFSQGEWIEYGNLVTYTRGTGSSLSSNATNGKKWNGNQSTFNYYDSTTKKFKALTGSTTIESTHYYYFPAQVNSSFIVGEANQDGTMNVNDTFKTVFGVMTIGDDYQARTYTRGNGLDFWLAYPFTGADDDGAFWGIRCVFSNSNVRASYLCGSYGNIAEGCHGVRPIVSLLDNVSLDWDSVLKQWNIK